ncbi:MoaD/ThiS family protein [Luteococcus sp. H138]|uniref:MoaD/ThiS family protein n=1 Tax=unclassified Luteococcus TaxID=2639923 RepID=UPI00313BEE5A
MQIRWFAGAAQAAGVAEETVEPTQSGTVREVLVTLHPEAATVLERCSFLADGRSLAGDQPWPATASVVDVLPPFTGG